MELPGLLVLIENKVRPQAVQIGQLARYHTTAVALKPRRRVISVFLAPSRGSGFAEARHVRREIRRQGRADLAVVISWSQVQWLLRFADGPDAEFRTRGMAAISKAIAAYLRHYRRTPTAAGSRERARRWASSNRKDSVDAAAAMDRGQPWVAQS